MRGKMKNARRRIKRGELFNIPVEGQTKNSPRTGEFFISVIVS